MSPQNVWLNRSGYSSGAMGKTVLETQVREHVLRTSHQDEAKQPAKTGAKTSAEGLRGTRGDRGNVTCLVLPDPGMVLLEVRRPSRSGAGLAEERTNKSVGCVNTVKDARPRPKSRAQTSAPRGRLLARSPVGWTSACSSSNRWPLSRGTVSYRQQAPTTEASVERSCPTTDHLQRRPVSTAVPTVTDSSF